MTYDLFNQPPVSDNYYNTTSQEGEALKERRRVTGKQNLKVLEIMRNLKEATPSRVHAYVLTASPLTSIRRALSTLTDDGYLVKTEEQKMGPFGHPEHVWKIKE